MGAILFIGPPERKTKLSSKQIWYGLCENALFPWQPIADLRIGVCLQKYSYLSCYLATKLSTKLKLRYRFIIASLHMQIIYFAYS